MVLNAILLNTKHYKVRIKGKVEQSRERSSALPYTSVGHPRLRSPTLCLLLQFRQTKKKIGKETKAERNKKKNKAKAKIKIKI